MLRLRFNNNDRWPNKPDDLRSFELARAGYVAVRRHREVARPSEVDRLRRVQALGRGQRGRPKRQVLGQRQV